ncbi:MAG: hypothetical protein RL011_1661 [Pseudomonadota bacterium]
MPPIFFGGSSLLIYRFLLTISMISGLLSSCGLVSSRTVDRRNGGNAGLNGDGEALLGLSKQNLSPGGLRRLTRSQFFNSARDILGEVTLKVQIEPDVPLLNLANLGAATVSTTPRGVELYEAAATELAAQIFKDSQRTATFVGCQVDSSNVSLEECVDSFINKIGRLAWRRPLTVEERASLRRVYQIVAADMSSPTEGLEAMTIAVFSSPNFIYRSEVGQKIKGGIRALSPFEVAARLSFLLWDTTPDNALLEAAEQGRLNDAESIKTEAQRMLASPRAKDALLRFFREWLGFDAVATLGKNQTAYPQFTPSLAGAMQSEFDAVVSHLVFNPGQNFTHLLNRPWTYVNAELATLYGLQPLTTDKTSMGQVELPAGSPRGGLLTMAGFLAAQAKPDTTAPIARGRYVLNRLLCEIVPAPPPDVPALPPDPSDGSIRTQRQRLEVHTASPGCASCHIKMDATGLALEQFDGIGAYRDTDRGASLDVGGALDGQTFSGAKDLGALLQTKVEVHRCIVKHLFRHTLGVQEQAGSSALIDDLTVQFAASGFDYQSLILNLVTSNPFRYVGDLR